jgi:hypothetical protein
MPSVTFDTDLLSCFLLYSLYEFDEVGSKIFIAMPYLIFLQKVLDFTDQLLGIPKL